MNMAEVTRFRPAFPRTVGMGMSAESQRAASQIRSIADDDAATFFKSERAARIANDLAALRENYARPRWDGYDARAISESTIAAAEQFLDSLPFVVPLPDIAPETTGAVSLEWRSQRDSIFIVSVYESGRLVFAGRFGGAKVNGVDFFAEGIPVGILAAIRRALR